MSTIKMPEFTAEASLYRPRMSYQMVANTADSRLQVTPALPRWDRRSALGKLMSAQRGADRKTLLAGTTAIVFFGVA